MFQVPNPNEKEVAAGRTTAFDTWLHLDPSSTDPKMPTFVYELHLTSPSQRQWLKV